MEVAKNYLSSGQFHGIEKGYIQEWLNDLDDKKISDVRANAALEIAAKSVRISWISAAASMISAFIALIAVLLKT